MSSSLVVVVEGARGLRHGIRVLRLPVAVPVITVEGSRLGVGMSTLIAVVVEGTQGSSAFRV
jgi:ABC-type nitrate/sulfonate/bicarbonate transport system permease component